MTHLSGDQTRGDSTAFLTGEHAARMSQNEVAALCMKAARGAGMSWGLAEEAGFAASWLTERGIDGPRHLLAHITAAQTRAWAELCPSVAAGVWNAAAGQTLCPVALGATLSDHANLPDGLGAQPIIAGPVDHPVLLCPFLGTIAAAHAGRVTVDWSGGHLEIGAGGPTDAQALTALEGLDTATLTLTLCAGSAPPPASRAAPVIAADTIAALNLLALRTTVPASEASRAGAGASSHDND
jgi:hypothetical protein